MEKFNRLIKLIGEDNYQKLANTNILIVGMGGVGGYALEGLVRSGILNITIIDHDIIDVTNLNRQLITNTTNIGLKKVDEAKKRSLLINPNINIKVLDTFLNSDNYQEIAFTKYDYIIDACDTTKTKELIIQECLNKKIKFISCMGTGNKFHPELLEITDLRKTTYDKLAKVLRKWVKDNRIKGQIPVVSSRELCEKCDMIGSTSYVPSTAGMLLASYVVNDIIKK